MTESQQNIPPWIDIEETVWVFGYDPRYLKLNSSKPIIRSCGICGILQVAERQGVKTRSKCRKCTLDIMASHSFLSQPVQIPNWIDIDETIWVFGYDPRYLKSKSARMIIRACKTCGKLQALDRHGVEDRSRCSKCSRGFRPDAHGTSLEYKRGCKCEGCRTAYSAENKTIRKTNGGKRRAYERRRTYGIDLSDDQVHVMLKTQNNSCAICKISLEYPSKKTHLDHDHETKRIRGLLCFGCNRGLGSFKDDIELLQAAMRYLAQ